jgi:hypothetical protein
MKYNRLGRTGLFVSELCLGTMTFGGRGEMWPIIGQLDQAAAATLLRLSIDAGINFFDTADVYSEGESERILGGRDQGPRHRPQGHHHRHQGQRQNRPGSQRGRALARAHPGCGQRQSRAARYRLYRPLPNSWRRPRHANRRNAAGPRRPGARRPGPIHRLLKPHGLADHEGARRFRPPRLGALRNRSGVFTRWPAATSSARSCR